MNSFVRLAVIITLVLTCCASVHAKEVSMDRIMAEHRITVVTTEKTDSISRYLLDLGIRNPNTTTLVELMLNAKYLKDGDSLLFLIDRKKTRRLIAQEEALLPCRSSAINPDEVAIYAAKAQGRNGWDILISAPNEKWLYWELDRLSNSGLGYLQLEARGTILERFEVRRLSVVSTEPRQVASVWISAQNTPGKDAIDWEFYPADEWDGQIDGGGETLFILNSESLSEKARKNVLPYVPKATREWLEGPDHALERSAARQVIHNQDGSEQQTSAIAAPSSRQLQLALCSYAKIDSVPESFDRTKLTELRKYGHMVVTARFSDRNVIADPKLLNDLAGSLTNTMSARTGFKCINRRDLKELALETYLNQLPDDEKLPERKAAAVAVVDLSSITTETDYSANSPRCLTSKLPPFSEAKPEQPREPDPDDKPLFCAHTYDEVNGSRANDPDFIRDHKDWQNNQMPTYRKALAEWEENQRDYENRRRNHDMEWVTTITESQQVKVTGNLRIYDLASGDVEQVGEVVFSCPVTGKGTRSTVYKEEKSVVRGEDSRPQAVTVPGSTNEISDETIITEALRSACNAAVEKLLTTALLPVDGEGESR